MKGYAYRLERQGPGTIEALSERLLARDLEQRFFAAAGGMLRLEDRRLEGDFLYLEFAGARIGHGPGRMPRARPLEDIDLADDETFGEDTAMVVHVPSRYVAVQYNHYGPRTRAIEEYLNASDVELRGHDAQTTYVFAASLRPDAYARLRAMGFIQELAFTIAVPGVVPGEMEAGLSVGEALRAPIPEGVEVISVSMKGRAGGALGRDRTMGLVDDLMQRGGDLWAAKVWGKPERGAGRKRPVDLVNDHLSDEHEIRPGRGHRFARPERWMALRDMLNGWLADGRLAH